ncbi:hypothetical protein [Acidithrix ferrooxidans]|uniref:Uncharacterized protein n=1 Tax=Acidithrix ferrooxidans TaxID=1280514 RepID=A0A0D8HJD0_9ACTN|nr:hypothetical protein [Acidithrix ferrooxidans]KJF18048.1 hypothetical protein AXFE_11470 [Acidithrix ferrooxidans]
MTINYLVDRYHESLVHRYLELVQHGPDYIHRITDTVQINGDTVNRSLSVDLTIPDDLPEPNAKTGEPRRSRSSLSLVPLMRGRRGRLFDNLNVTSASGTSLSVLAQEENKLLASLMLETQFRKIVPANIGNLEPNFDTVWKIGQTISNIPYMEPPIAKIIFDKYFGNTDQLKMIGITDDNMTDLRKLAEFFVYSFLTTAEVTAGPLEKVLIKYSYDSKYRDDAQYRDDFETPNLISRMRMLLGQSPYSLRFRIPLAFNAQSYHFRMDAPPNCYCAVQRVLARSGTALTGPDGNPVHHLEEWEPPHKRVQYRSTTAHPTIYAHIYIHGLHKVDHEPLFARVIFYEIPPGSIGTVTIISSITAFALLVLTIVFHWLVAAPSGQPAIAGLVVALPATAAFWLQPTFEKRDLVTAPLSSRVGLLASGGVAYASALLLVVADAFSPVPKPLLWVLQGIMTVLAGLGIYIGVKLALICRHNIATFRKIKN